VDSIQLDSLFKKGDWLAYYKQYPGASGVVTWSRVGFNAEGTQALFYEGYRCGELCGTGHHIVMEKKNGSWMLGPDIVVWVSSSGLTNCRNIATTRKIHFAAQSV